MPGTRPGMTTEKTEKDARASHRIPREHVGGALERRERGPERALELLIQLLRGPAVGAMDAADRPRLVEQEHFVVAHRKDLPADSFGAIGGEIDDERRDLLRRHLLEALDAALLLLGLRRDRIDHARPGERRDAV